MTDVVSIPMYDAFNKVSSTSAFSLVTDMVPILTKRALENMHSTLVYGLVTDATDKDSSPSSSSLVTHVVPILKNGALENMD